MVTMSETQTLVLGTGLVFDRAFWLYTAAHVLMCRRREHSDCLIEMGDA